MILCEMDLDEFEEIAPQSAVDRQIELALNPPFWYQSELVRIRLWVISARNTSLKDPARRLNNPDVYYGDNKNIANRVENDDVMTKTYEEISEIERCRELGKSEDLERVQAAQEINDIFNEFEIVKPTRIDHGDVEIVYASDSD